MFPLFSTTNHVLQYTKAMIDLVPNGKKCVFGICFYNNEVAFVKAKNMVSYILFLQNSTEAKRICIYYWGGQYIENIQAYGEKVSAAAIFSATFSCSRQFGMQCYTSLCTKAWPEKRSYLGPLEKQKSISSQRKPSNNL